MSAPVCPECLHLIEDHDAVGCSDCPCPTEVHEAAQLLFDTALRLHQPSGPFGDCLGCGHPHPCPTRRAITCQGDQK